MSRPAPPRATDSAPACRWQDGDLLLSVQVQPRARGSEFAGLHGDHLKIRLAAPPVDGQANAALIDFLAEAFGVPKRQVVLVAGASGRSKRLRIAAPARLPAGLPIPPRPA